MATIPSAAQPICGPTMDSVSSVARYAFIAELE
jgi:hypothetical protein